MTDKTEKKDTQCDGKRRFNKQTEIQKDRKKANKAQMQQRQTGN